MRIVRTLLLLSALLFAPAAQAGERLVEALRSPGHVLLIRHALAPGTGDPASFDVADCTTQRNLDARGRQQAREIGDWLRARGLMPQAIRSSPWCRCKDTATEMGLAPVRTHPGLASFFGDYARKPEVMADFRSLITELRGEAGPHILITHQVVISAATGDFTRSGEGIVARIEPDGALTSLGSLDFGTGD